MSSSLLLGSSLILHFFLQACNSKPSAPNQGSPDSSSLNTSASSLATSDPI
ncbi:hypothetical protein YC2023_096730 [Brassica napus]